DIEKEEQKEEPREESKKDEEDEEETKEERIQKLREEIDSLIGGEAFKNLANEVIDLSYSLIANSTQESFLYQSFLFSINDGCGYEDYLDLLARIVNDTEIKEVNRRNPVSKWKVPPISQASGQAFDAFRGELESFFNRNRSDKLTIVSFDICEWLNKLNDKSFKDFMLSIDAHSQDYIFVFRVPYIEKEVLQKVFFVLNDLAFIRVLSFPPLSNDEIKEHAKRGIEKFKFDMDEDAWMPFFQRVKEEKSDGRFYGATTVNKIINELLYKKQVNNIKEKTDDKKITINDTKLICLTEDFDERSGYEMLNDLVGCDKIKEQIDQIIAQVQFAKMNKELGSPCIHMRFVGNPGTGKTTVARIVGKIFKEKGILRIGDFFEYSGRDFCGRYIGETAPKTSSICRDAYGSVLFIDEAYSLYREDNDRDYGKEALDTLIAEMENHRSDLVVIMAGYTDDMQRLLKGNAGLASRIPYTIEFPNFTREQLYDIYLTMLKKGFEYEEDLLPLVKDYFMGLSDKIINAKEFSNGRFVRNLYERTWSKAAMRTQLEMKNKVIITKEDFVKAINDSEFKLNEKPLGKTNKVGFLD
ncbi:MAG: AAA family ATPase, partial [Bacilli bacterium]|nr:AAA family ATPase [Bacilli bacterium]